MSILLRWNHSKWHLIIKLVCAISKVFDKPIPSLRVHFPSTGISAMNNRNNDVNPLFECLDCSNISNRKSAVSIIHLMRKDWLKLDLSQCGGNEHPFVNEQYISKTSHNDGSVRNCLGGTEELWSSNITSNVRRLDSLNPRLYTLKK